MACIVARELLLGFPEMDPVKNSTHISDKFWIACEILAYLSEHAEAQDTLDGIMHWWLLEREIRHQTGLVKKALGELVDRGLVIERKTWNTRAHYRINPEKVSQIIAFLDSCDWGAEEDQA